MRIDKFTQKMQEAVQASQDVASQFNQQEITNEHFLLALLDQADGITRPLLEKMGVAVPQLRDQLERGTARAAAKCTAGTSTIGSATTCACSTPRKRRWRN